MNHLRREQAPLSDEAWSQIDDEARRVLELHLAGRKAVDFKGPKGLRKAAVNVGRIDPLKGAPVEGVQSYLREVQPLVEYRVPFQLSRAEMDAIDRGCEDPDFDPLHDAAKKIARAEDIAIFHGYEQAGIKGITEASKHPPVILSDDFELFPRAVADATRSLRASGVDGPYALAVGPRCYAGLLQATAHGGYPILEIVRRAIDGPIIWAPAVDGSIVLSMRGDDFELTVGQDVSIGYLSHTADTVTLYFIETMTFRVLTPEAAVALVYKNGKKK